MQNTAVAAFLVASVTLALPPSGALLAQQMTSQPARLGASADTAMSHLKGRWSGAGVAVMANGREEPFNCIATYFQDTQGTELKQNMRCESPNVQLATAAQMRLDGDTVTGVWQEKNYEQNGRISGRVTPAGVSAIVTHNDKQASVEIATAQCEQTVTVTPLPGEMIRTVTARLKRC
jgi:hypothetical protein